MNRMLRLSVGCLFLLALLSPQLAVASCSCGYPSCSGEYCYCCGLESYCFGSPPPQNPCNSSLAFDASQEELATFKARIDTWSQRKDLQPLVAIATDLYDSVFFQDSQRFIEASDEFKRAINSLSEETRRSLIRLEERRVRPE